jgi:hypothetical protein
MYSAHKTPDAFNSTCPTPQDRELNRHEKMLLDERPPASGQHMLIELPHKAVPDMINHFKEQTAQLPAEVPTNSGILPTDIDTRDFKTLKRSHQQKWSERIKQTHAVLDFGFSPFNSEKTVICYSGQSLAKAKPIGMIGFSVAGTKECVLIPAIVALPGARDVGTKLVEAAASYAEEKGLHGRLVLWPMSEDAEHAFKAMGFVQTGVILSLHPESSTKWHKDEQGWHFKKGL